MSSQEFGEMCTWKPPTEAEQKVIEARRDRNNKISQLMGQYLLKGYKMLAIGCQECNCILLEDRTKKKYCIGCSEVDDGDTIKDNPAVNEEAARKTVEENQHRNLSNQDTNEASDIQWVNNINGSISSSVTTDTTTTTTPFIAESNENVDKMDDGNLTQCSCRPKDQHLLASHKLVINSIDISEEICRTMKVLRSRLSWATENLSKSQGLQESKQLVTFISEISAAMISMKRLCE